MSGMSLASAKILLTGATGGLGHAIARELASHGAELTLTGRRTAPLHALADELDATIIAADLADADGVARLIDKAGPVDALVANAGLPASGPLSGFTDADIDRTLAVNLRAPMILARNLVGGMRSRARGHLVFIGSVAGWVPTPRATVYNATKFGLRGFSLALRHELHNTGVGVSIVEPGFVRDAGMFADSKITLPPLYRTSTPTDVARAVTRAIREDIGEILVAPIEMRLGAALSCLSPTLMAPIQRLVGADRINTRLDSDFHHGS
ncbi:SDR family NAD(P)-dependent oxidoreductase [Nocardia sp. NPDC058058]|uniref:SDR family NAD(P)-dependent oxidoreductase n=1 Tax=Nocardia sp. NPDC058058 TaxID=3346317 RepID=UPI0036DF44A5